MGLTAYRFALSTSIIPIYVVLSSVHLMVCAIFAGIFNSKWVCFLKGGVNQQCVKSVYLHNGVVVAYDMTVNISVDYILFVVFGV